MITFQRLLLISFLLALFGCNAEHYGYKASCDKLEELASNENYDALAALGDCYRTGLGRKQDIDMALDLYMQSSRNGSVIGKTSEAAMYLINLESDNDHKKAIKLLQEAIFEDYPRSFFLMGLALKNGFGVVENVVHARAFFTRAAELEHEASIVILISGTCYSAFKFEIDEVKCSYWKDMLEKVYGFKIQDFLEILMSELNSQFMRRYIVSEADILVIRNYQEITRSQ